MSKSRRITHFAAGTVVGLLGCDTCTSPRQSAGAGTAVLIEQPRDEAVSKKMKVTIGTQTFMATLDDNPAAAKLRAMLPLTLDMSELNGNEKFARLSAPLPVDATDPGTIQTGDLMLWGPIPWCSSTRASRPRTATPGSDESTTRPDWPLRLVRGA
jgi:hypothetical protein